MKYNYFIFTAQYKITNMLITKLLIPLLLLFILGSSSCKDECIRCKRLVGGVTGNTVIEDRIFCDPQDVKNFKNDLSWQCED